MENNYIDVISEETNESTQISQIYDSIYCMEYLMLLTSSISTLLAGFLLNDLVENNRNPERPCQSVILIMYYYSHYLLIDGSAQLIICVVLFLVFANLKKFDVKKEVCRQLFLQVFDTGLSLLVLLSIQIIIQQKQYCNSYDVGIFLMLYSFWVYLLFFFLAVAQFNQ